MQVLYTYAQLAQKYKVYQGSEKKNEGMKEEKEKHVRMNNQEINTFNLLIKQLFYCYLQSRWKNTHRMREENRLYLKSAKMLINSFLFPAGTVGENNSYILNLRIFSATFS